MKEIKIEHDFCKEKLKEIEEKVFDYLKDKDPKEKIKWWLTEGYLFKEWYEAATEFSYYEFLSRKEMPRKNAAGNVYIINCCCSNK